MDVDFGDLPTWITAVATMLALGAAIYAGIRAAKLLKIEIARDRKRDENELRQQAILVAAWYGVIPVHPDAPDDDAGTYGPVVRNGGALPIYQVNVELLPIDRTSGEHTYVYEVVPPGQWFVHARNRGLYTTRPVVVHSHPKHAPQYQVAVSFRDAAGNSWRRDQNGDLVRRIDTETPVQPTIVAPGGSLRLGHLGPSPNFVTRVLSGDLRGGSYHRRRPTFVTRLLSERTKRDKS